MFFSDIITCDRLQIANGQLEYDSSNQFQPVINDTVTYSCTFGYFLVGSVVRTCGDGGRWSGIQPVCKSKS